MIIDLVVKLTKFPSKINFRQAGEAVLTNDKVEVEKTIIKSDGTKYNYCSLL